MWSYCGETGPEFWPKFCPAAAGTRQSPIDIQKAYMTSAPPEMQKLKFRYFPNDMTTVENTGHGWKVDVDDGASEIGGGPLQTEYQLAQVHMHWGASDEKGSEHTVDGKRYAAEVHLVHWSKKYDNFQEATKHPDGLCVLGVLLKLGDIHRELDKIIEKIPDIKHKNDTVKLATSLNPKNLIPDAHNYWTYAGSLTTPPCSECVIWIIFSEPMEISSEQLIALRTLRCHTLDACDHIGECEDKLLYNYRPTAPLGDRAICSNSS